MISLRDLLARNLGISRGQVDRLLLSKRVQAPDGTSVTDGRRKVAETELPLTLLVDRAPVDLQVHHHLMLHKPAGYLSALRDKTRPVAQTLVEDAPLAAELRAVGRLDLDTTGLLLWTTDGQWLQRLTHPKNRFPRTYQALLARPYAPPPDGLVLEDGHRPEITSLQTLDASLRHPALQGPDGGQLAEITIVGGAYHEVRRIFAALDSHVVGLCRVAFGRLRLPVDLPPGAHRPIRPEEI